MEVQARELPGAGVEGGADTGSNPPIRAQVLAIAPTPFFGDYGCHVRILEEARAG